MGLQLTVSFEFGDEDNNRNNKSQAFFNSTAIVGCGVSELTMPK